MDALEALHQRVSAPRLGGTVPTPEQLDNMFKAALRAPDHALLRPWRFLIVEGQNRYDLGDLFVAAMEADNPAATEEAKQKSRSKPLRAPMLIVAIASVREHPKVPEVEQIISAGAAVQNMLVAAFAQGLGAMWRTGGMAYHPVVEQGLGLEAAEKIVGYLYLGQVDGRSRTAPELATEKFFSRWERK